MYSNSKRIIALDGYSSGLETLYYWLAKEGSLANASVSNIILGWLKFLTYCVYGNPFNSGRTWNPITVLILQNGKAASRKDVARQMTTLKPLCTSWSLCFYFLSVKFTYVHNSLTDLSISSTVERQLRGYSNVINFLSSGALERERIT